MEEYNKQLWDAIDMENSFSEESRAREAFRKFQQIVLSERPVKGRRFSILHWGILVSAALSIPLAVLSVALLLQSGDDPVWQEVSTRPGQCKQVVLADNTKVTMNGGSTIVYPSSFTNDNRQIYFSGEGYFEVKSDESHPFDVITNDARIRVTGTRFNLKSYSDDDLISVGLDEGHVHFESEAGRSDKLVADMVPGDKLLYNRETGSLNKTFSNAGFGLWRKGEYYFKNEPLSQIASDIERIYGVRVLIEREDILDFHYHIALVNGETLDDLVKILSGDSSLNVSQEGNTIIIR